MSALQKAHAQAEAQTNVIQQMGHREAQPDNRRLKLQVEWRGEEVERMESAWKSAVRERDEAIQEREGFKAELEILRAEKDTAVAKAKEEGRQELARKVAPSLQATIAIVGSVEEFTLEDDH